LHSAWPTSARRRPDITIEVLTPDFRGREAAALDALAVSPPDVFNHNMETVPRLYREVRPGASYEGSLKLIRDFGARFPGVPTKTGLMLGLGETEDEVVEVMRDLRAHGCDLLTLGQYLRPSPAHLPVIEYITPARFDALREKALELGFSEVAAGPLVRSSYRADVLHQRMPIMTDPRPSLVTVNGQIERLDAVMSVGSLLDGKALRTRRIAVERNGEIVPRSAFDCTWLNHGDRVEIVVAVGGG
jgi:thiamine biosynthesis protein ThiS